MHLNSNVLRAKFFMFIFCTLTIQIVHGNTNPFTIAPLAAEYESKVYSMNVEVDVEEAITRCLLNTSGKVYSIQQGKKISQPSNT